VNVLWSLLNLAIGGALFRAGRVAGQDAALGICFAGVAAIGLFSSVRFAGKNDR